jgi:serine/threonine protein kinase
MVYGQTPFARITGMIPKLHAITDPKHTIPMPPVANPHLTSLISACLERHPHRRITIAEILSHQFLRPAAAATPASKGGSGGADGEPASPAPSGLSAAQLQGLLEQIQKHGANVDVGAVTQEVFRQIATGESNVSISPLLRKHAKGGNGGEIKTTVSETGDGEMGAAESVAARVGAMDLNAGAGAEAKPDAAR